MSEWQPIETAPKDGNAILLFAQWPEDDWSVVDVGFWDQDRWELQEAKISRAPGLYTHWMPIPAPPETCEINA